MRRQRYRNEASYPCNDPVVTRRPSGYGRKKVNKPVPKKPVQLKMQLT